jgi:hypothetical protein
MVLPHGGSSTKEANTQKNLYKANVFLLLGHLPDDPALTIRNKLCGYSKNIMQDLILIFHAI